MLASIATFAVSACASHADEAVDAYAREPAAQVAPAARALRKKFVGNITTRGAVRPGFAELWDQITPENEGKWGSVEGVRDRMNWAPLDAAYAYAKQNGIVFKAHTMVWGSQQPSWLADLPLVQQAAEVEAWIRAYCERYPETALIDVVNEPPPHTQPVYAEALGGAGVSGYDWIVNAFKLTKKHCPNATLILNDYNNIEWDADHRRFIQIAQAVKRAGAPIDAVGAQAHDAYRLPTSDVRDKITRLAQETGLPVYITEYDIPIASDLQQKTVMESQFTMFWNHPDVRGITLWGYVTGATWVAGSGLMSALGVPRPALTWLRAFLQSEAEPARVETPRCALPTTFAWTSTGPIIAPKSPVGRDFVSIKDPTVVRANGMHHMYATVYDQAKRAYSMVYLSFDRWEQAGAAPQFPMDDAPTRGGVAPQLFYFAPKKQWVLIYQWGASYSTNTDPGQPLRWSARKPLLVNGPPGALDYWVICDDAFCHLFFSADDGKLYASKLPIDAFPGTFDGYRVVMADTQANLFEASNVFKIAGAEQYLLLVEAMSPRYFRSWTATRLDGPWLPLAATAQNPFAGSANVSFPDGAWTRDISHGDMVRTNPDQTMTIDPCAMQFVYQGVDPSVRATRYDALPYRLGLLTLSR
ncbi:MAG: non-reducing end alpha-L-arabinofuranosidase family hydrolase [Polyangiales bacterium]